MKNKNISVLLSLLFPGLGHLYIGKYIDGICFIIGTAVLYYALFVKSSYLMTFNNPRSFIVWGALVFIYIYAIISSYIKTRQTHE